MRSRNLRPSFKNLRRQPKNPRLPSMSSPRRTQSQSSSWRSRNRRSCLPQVGRRLPCLVMTLMAPTGPSPVTAEQARAVVQAMLADPVLVDALVKARGGAHG